MENDVKEFLSELLKQLKSIDYIKPEDIPNIDLYMDQVTTFMDEQLAASKRYESDKILTKTMINNYAKNKTSRPLHFMCKGRDFFAPKAPNNPGAISGPGALRSFIAACVLNTQR